MVVDIACGQRTGDQAVLLRVRRAGEDAALEVGVALDLDVEAALARVDAALFPDRAVGAVGLALRVGAAGIDGRADAERWHADTGLHAR